MTDPIVWDKLQSLERRINDVTAEWDAADEIYARRARISELEGALEKIENAVIVPDCEQSAWVWEVARTALERSHDSIKSLI